jgi:hypothetical protein
MEDNKSDDDRESTQNADSAAEVKVEAPKTSSKTKKQTPRWLIGVAAGMGILILVLVIVLIAKLSPGKSSPVAGPAGPEAAVLDLSKINSAADIKAITGGQLQLDDVLVAPGASLALYNPAQHRMEIGFFRVMPPKEAQDQLGNVQSFSEISAMTPDVLFILSLKSGLTQCDPSVVERYQVFANKNLQGSPEYESIDFSDGSGIASLGCRLDQPAVIYAGFKRDNSPENDSGTAAQSRWDLQMSGPLVVVQSVNKVHYDSANAISVAAIWNRMDNIVEVGYFATELGPQDRMAIRNSKSMLVQPAKKPSVVVSLYLNKDVMELELSNVVKYGVTFYRDPSVGLDFAGTDGKEGFYYIVSPDKTSQLSGLRGSLGENEYIQGRLKHEANKIIDQVPCKFSWELVFDTPLIDLFSEPAESEETAVTKGGGGKEDQKEEENGSFARVSAGEARREFGTVIALFYSVENDLSVGFYADQLSAAEKEQIKKNKELWRYVNNKRPNMVMLFDFKRGSQDASVENLNSYTVYLARDKIGSFYFPGTYDQKSVTRPVDTLKRDEIKKLSGALKDGGTVSLRIKGEQIPKDSPTRFAWDVNVTAEVFQVR